MKSLLYISLLCLMLMPAHAKASEAISVQFYGETLQFNQAIHLKLAFDEPLTPKNIQSFYASLSETNWQPLVQQMIAYRQTTRLDDWMYFQLIRKVAESISPKASNYPRYTLYKCFLLAKSGYDVRIKINAQRILFYVQSPDNIYEIPCFNENGKQFICFNSHDYPSMDLGKEQFEFVPLPQEASVKPFSYEVTRIPMLAAKDETEKIIQFSYNNTPYRFKVKFNPAIQQIFANFPVVDYEKQLNIPLSGETYASLLPALKKILKGMKQKDGVEWLMHFTRDAFGFEPDTQQFGKEKRLSPELTLLFDQSDCEDRVALFYYLVKELYNIPMVVLVYPAHVSIAVKLDKPIGKTILYNNERYTLCEPTPQSQELYIGETLPSLHKTPYAIAYAYEPLPK